jgi:hypothetical protein
MLHYTCVFKELLYGILRCIPYGLYDRVRTNECNVTVCQLGNLKTGPEIGFFEEQIALMPSNEAVVVIK